MKMMQTSDVSTELGAGISFTRVVIKLIFKAYSKIEFLISFRLKKFVGADSKLPYILTSSLYIVHLFEEGEHYYTD